MPEPLTTLPGDIPGLLRRGSPLVLGTGHHALHLGTTSDGDTVVYCDEDQEFIERAEDFGPFALDLTDPTGRAHAAWWIADESYRQYLDADLGFLHAESELLQLARSGHHMEPAQIDTLTRLVLRLAGRAS